MATIANSFSGRVNSKEENRSIEEILLQDYPLEVKTRNPSKGNKEVIEFRDGSKVLIYPTANEIIVKEILAYKAWPFVKVGVGNALVSTDHTGVIYIQFPDSNKSIKLNSTPDNKIKVIGLGGIKNYNGHEYTFD